MRSKSDGRLNILHYPTAYPDPSRGDPYGQIFIKEHVLAMQQYHAALVLHFSPLPPLGRFPVEITRVEEDGIDTIRVYMRKFRIPLISRLFVYTVLLTVYLRIIASGFRPDVLHMHIFAEVRHVLFLSKLLRIPGVITEHWTALCPDDPQNLPPSRLSKAKWVYENSRLVLPVCEYLRQCIKTSTGAHFDHRIIYNAVNTSTFRFIPRKAPSKVAPIRLLTVARLEAQKDFPTLFDATRRLNQSGVITTLDIVGDGPQRNEFENLAKALSIEGIVTFHGKQPKDVIARMMQDSDIFILSTKWENSPCVIGEALSCGTPVVASSVGGIPELVGEQDGLLVPKEDAEALAEAIRQIVNCRERYDSVTISKRAHARFSYEAIGKQLDEVYRSVVQ